MGTSTGISVVPVTLETRRSSLGLHVSSNSEVTFPMENIRVLIADDHPIFRQGIRGVLDAEPDIEVVGDAADGKQAIALARALSPDVVLLDVHMPNGDGMEVARTVKLHLPR